MSLRAALSCTMRTAFTGTLCASAAALAAGAPAASAWNTGHGPRYTLHIAEGETTLPEYKQVASTSASAEEPSAPVAVSIVRSGTTVYRSVGEGSAWLSQVPQAGETVTLESPVGTLIGSFVYDGKPTIGPKVCAGSTSFEGENSSGDTVEGSFRTYSLETNPYGRVIGVQSSDFGEAQVKSLTGTTFGGSFLVPLLSGETVNATESLKTPLANGGTYTYVSEYERPVGGCPAPPPPYDPPAPPPALQGSILKLAHVTIHRLLKSGWLTSVSINQAGTVTEDLYAQDGQVPAVAASVRARHHRKTPPAVLLARGSSTASAAGVVRVTLHATRQGHAQLARHRQVKAMLVITLRSSSGSTLTLGRRSVILGA
jgi:hypothetical protein